MAPACPSLLRPPPVRLSAAAPLCCPLPARCSVINCAAQAAPAACEGEGEAAARAVNVPTRLLDALERHAERHGRCGGARAWDVACLTPAQLLETSRLAAVFKGKGSLCLSPEGPRLASARPSAGAARPPLPALPPRSRPALVHLSTDHVYNGGRGMYREDSELDPINTYGRTKVDGEAAVAKRWPGRHVILRPSIIYGPPPPSPTRRGLFLQSVDAALAAGVSPGGRRGGACARWGEEGRGGGTPASRGEPPRLPPGRRRSPPPSLKTSGAPPRTFKTWWRPAAPRWRAAPSWARPAACSTWAGPGASTEWTWPWRWRRWAGLRCTEGPRSGTVHRRLACNWSTGRLQLVDRLPFSTAPPTCPAPAPPPPKKKAGARLRPRARAAGLRRLGAPRGRHPRRHKHGLRRAGAGAGGAADAL